jgi:PAS domain S-box-containing protein
VSGKFASGRSGDATASAADSRGFFAKISQRSIDRPFAPAASSKDALLLLKNFEESGRGWFWSTDAEGRITYLSTAICDLLRLQASELIGSPFTDLFDKDDKASDRQRSLPFILTKQSKFDDLPLKAATDSDEIWWAVSGRQLCRFSR